MATLQKKNHFYSELMHLVVPIAVQSFMLALVSVTDAVMLGRLDQQSMASVSQAGNVQFFLSLLVTGFSIGVGIMAAQYWGKRAGKSIAKLAPTCLRIVLVLRGAVTLAALFAPRTLMAILTNDPVLIPLGADYLRVVAPSYFLCGIMEVCGGMVRGLGNSWLPMVVTIFGACVMRIVWIYTIFAWKHTLPALYVSYPISWVITAAMHVVCFVYFWKRIRRKLEQTAPAAADIRKES